MPPRAVSRRGGARAELSIASAAESWCLTVSFPGNFRKALRSPRFPWFCSRLGRNRNAKTRLRDYTDAHTTLSLCSRDCEAEAGTLIRKRKGGFEGASKYPMDRRSNPRRFFPLQIPTKQKSAQTSFSPPFSRVALPPRETSGVSAVAVTLDQRLPLGRSSPRRDPSRRQCSLEDL